MTIMNNLFRLPLLFLVFLAFLNTACTQDKGSYRMTCIAFYNLENLFDTINQEGVTDEEFTPKGKNNWNPDRYMEKLGHMATVISKI